MYKVIQDIPFTGWNRVYFIFDHVMNIINYKMIQNCSHIIYSAIQSIFILYIYRVIRIDIYTEWVKKCDLRRLVQNCNFFVQLSCMVFFNIFRKFVTFLVLQWPEKNLRIFFSLKIKSLEKQKCIKKYFYRNLKF